MLADVVVCFGISCYRHNCHLLASHSHKNVSLLQPLSYLSHHKLKRCLARTSGLRRGAFETSGHQKDALSKQLNHHNCSLSRLTCTVKSSYGFGSITPFNWTTAFVPVCKHQGRIDLWSNSTTVGGDMPCSAGCYWTFFLLAKHATNKLASG